MRIKRTVIFLAAAFLFCGCFTEPSYKFTPPADEIGKNCIANCSSFQKECEDQENTRAEFCDHRQQQQMDRCNERIQREQHRGSKITECGKTEACSASMSHCGLAYRRCYKSCGGGVEEE